ncbi:hypothetical protein, partial [Levilinea saccharolytica]
MNRAAMHTRLLEWLGDPQAARFSPQQLDAALRSALDEIAEAAPDSTEGTLVCAAGREQGISTAAGFERARRVLAVWYPLTAGQTHPPRAPFRSFWRGGVLVVRLGGRRTPQAGESLRVWTLLSHCLEGLDGADRTSLPACREELLTLGAAGLAAQVRANALTESYGERTPAGEWLALGQQRLAEFRER